MDNRRIFIFIAVILIISSCGKLKNPKERNVISFKNDVDSVAFAIENLNKIFKNRIQKPFIYGIDESSVLFIEDSLNNNKYIGLITDETLEHEYLLPFVDISKRDEFVQLVKYLYKNHIYRCNYKKGHYLYLYKDDIYMADRQEDLQRFIVFAKNKAEIENLLEDNFVKAAHGGKDNLSYKIIDQKDNLFLLAPKDAEIWEN